MIERQILGIALEHQLVSRLTSLVAVDRTPSRPDAEPFASTNVPLNLPDGWNPAVFMDQQVPAMMPAPAMKKAGISGAQLARLKATPAAQAGAAPPRGHRTGSRRPSPA